MPTRRRRRLTSLARSVLSSTSQRRFSQTSARDTQARMTNARERLVPIADRRYVQYRTARRSTGRGRYTVNDRATRRFTVGRFVGMAH